MARAQGARAQMALAFETTYGTPPASGYTKMPFASTTLGAEQPLQTSELLGYGRDPQGNVIPGQIGWCEMRQRRGNRREHCDPSGLGVDQGGHPGSGEKRDQEPRRAREDPLRHSDGHERGTGDHDGRTVRSRKAFRHNRDALDDIAAAVHSQSQSRGHLTYGNEHRCCRSERNDHGMRDETHEPAQMRQRRAYLEEADEDGEEQGQFHEAGRSRRRDLGECCEYQRGDGRRRPRDHHHRRAPECRDDGYDHCRVQAILGWQTGDDGKGDTLRQHDGRVRQTGERVSLQTVGAGPGKPARGGKHGRRNRMRGQRQGGYPRSG